MWSEVFKFDKFISSFYKQSPFKASLHPKQSQLAQKEIDTSWSQISPKTTEKNKNY